MGNSMRIRSLIFLIAGWHAIALFAGFLTPYDAREQDRDLAYAPPTRIHFRGASGFHLRPFVYVYVSDIDGYREDRTREYPIQFVVKGSAYSILGFFQSNLHWIGVESPARIMLFGADGFGRDEFSRLLVGGQISLAVGLLATLVTLATAAAMGTVSGFYAGWVDESLMGLSELSLSLPWLYFLLGVRAFFPLHMSPGQTFLLLVGVMGIIGWARPARLVRGVVLSARNRNYVSAARSFGGSDLYLIRRHILPEMFGVLLTQSALLVPMYVAGEAALSFFGLGVSEPVPSWGNMMAGLQHYSVLVSYGWLLAPAVALVITSVMYGMLADALHRRTPE